MRILMLSDYFLPRGSGGVERVVYEIARRQVAVGHEITVLTLGEEDEPRQEAIEGIEVRRVKGHDLTSTIGIQLAVSPAAWGAFVGLLDEKPFDLVNAHNIFFHLSLVAAVRTRNRGLPLVVTSHLGPVTELGARYGLPSRLYEQTAGRIILTRADAVTAVSMAVADHARSLGARADRLTVVPNGVDTKRFAPPAQPPSRKDVLFVGRLIFNKGPQHLVEAMPAVLARVPQARFSLAGDGRMLDELQSRTRELGVERAVRFLGRRDDVEQLLRSASVFVRPSLLEGLSLTVLEAMSCGLPVVATPVGGTAEVVHDGVNGFLVPPGDVDELAQRIGDLLEQPERARSMGAAGRQVVENGYDWDSVAERMAEVYREVLDRRMSQPDPNR